MAKMKAALVRGHRRVGHLGVQFASKFGYRVVAISRGKGAEALGQKRGASIYSTPISSV
jgi:D-arabinose 1-dehydrogenase-like Zn-dependent alcohol dehydrogenase